MKKILYIGSAIAALLLVGCKKEYIDVEQTSTESAETVLTIDLPETTKITWDSQAKDIPFKSEWETGDKISVQTGSNRYATYTFSGFLDETNKKRARFYGTTSPMANGKVIYPALSNNRASTYTFPSTYEWENTDGKLKSYVPMVGTVSGSKITLSLAASAVLITYSKVPQNAGRLRITMDQPIAGSAAISEKMTISGNNSSKTIYYTFESGGTHENMQFIIPVPEGKYSSISVALDRYNKSNNIWIEMNGSQKVSTKNRNFAAGNLHKMPTIIPSFPNYTFTEMQPGEQFVVDGEYILAYDRGIIDGVHKAWVNGDDNTRQTVDAKIITLNNPSYGTDNGKLGIKIDYADYITGDQIITNKDGDVYTVKMERGESVSQITWEKVNGQYTGYVVWKDGGRGYSNSQWNNTPLYRYYSPSETAALGYTEAIWANGGFIATSTDLTSNIKIFRFISSDMD